MLQIEAGQATTIRPRLTNRTLFVLGTMTIIDMINFNLLSPYVDEMISNFLDAGPQDSRVEETVGSLIGLYSLCEVLFSVFWGYLSDRIGRKPVILIGLGGSIVAPIVFGLAPSLTVVFLARGLDGFFCGNVGVVKTYLGELVDETNEARAFSLIAICWSCGLFLGPLLGGELVHPAKTAPGIFADTVFETHPYLLPNLVYACLAAVAWIIGLLFLEETLPRNSSQAARQFQQASTLSSQQMLPSSDAVAVNDRESNFKLSAICSPKQLPLWRLMKSYALASGYYAAWVQNFVLLVSLPASTHGFGFGPREIGIMQNFAAVGLMLTQLFFYPRLTKRFGFFRCFVAGAALNLFVTLPFPAYGLLADAHVYGGWRFVPLAAMQFFGTIGVGFCFPTIFVWINRATEDAPRGTANGIANTMGALARSVFPPIASGLLAIGLKCDLPGGHYLPIFVNAVALIAALAFASAALKKQGDSHCREVDLSCNTNQQAESAFAPASQGGCEL